MYKFFHITLVMFTFYINLLKLYFCVNYLIVKHGKKIIDEKNSMDIYFIITKLFLLKI